MIDVVCSCGFPREPNLGLGPRPLPAPVRAQPARETLEVLDIKTAGHLPCQDTPQGDDNGCMGAQQDGAHAIFVTLSDQRLHGNCHAVVEFLDALPPAIRRYCRPIVQIEQTGE
jgi:hypothetical protein